jgi:hypothetical protein
VTTGEASRLRTLALGKRGSKFTLGQTQNALGLACSQRTGAGARPCAGEFANIQELGIALIKDLLLIRPLPDGRNRPIRPRRVIDGIINSRTFASISSSGRWHWRTKCNRS